MKNILITDDDQGILDIFKIILEQAGYEVQVYGDASFILENKYTSPDLFFLDRKLSGQDGLKICKFLKSQNSTKDIPVIIISATQGIKKLAEEAGADDFIEKPFEIKDLLSVIEKWI